MDQLYLLDEMKFMPQLSLATSPSEYFAWQDAMENFFAGRGFSSVVKMYYAEETFDKDVLQWWLDVDDPCRTWEDMKFLLRQRFVYSSDAIKKVVAAVTQKAFASLSLVSSKAIQNEDSQLLQQKVEVHVVEAPVVYESDDFSLASGLHSSASYCDTQSDIEIDDTNDVSDGLSMMAQEAHIDGTAIMVKGQRSNIFQSECKIQDKICKLIIDGGSFTNVVSSDLVHALSLSTRRLPKPRYVQWMNQSGTLKITHKARVKFSVENYVDSIDCDVAPMSACHLLLGRPWQFDLDATYKGRSNCYSFVHKGVHHMLKPMFESAIQAEVFATVKKKKKEAAEIASEPRTALLQEGENDVTVCDQTIASKDPCSKPKIEASIFEEGQTIPSIGSEKMLKQSPNKFGSLSIIDDGNLVASEGKLAATYKVDSSIISINNDPSKEILETDPILYHDGPYIVDLKDNGQIMNVATNDPANYRINEAIGSNSKPRTALFQGGEDDEPMVHQNIKLGAFNFGVKHNIMKEGNLACTATMPDKIIFNRAKLHKEQELFEFKKPPDQRGYIHVGCMRVNIIEKKPSPFNQVSIMKTRT